MNSTLQSIVQSLLAAVGGFLILKGIDAGTVGQGVGIAMGLTAVIWGIVEKNANGSAIIAVITNVTNFIGGILIAKGKTNPEAVSIWLGVIVSLTSAILSAFHVTTTATLKAATRPPIKR